MSDAPSEWSIVKAVAKIAASRITRKVIADLQRIDHTLSGDDSELKTAWDEICVQVQYEQSIFWDAYDETVRAHVLGHIAKLSVHERQAIWMQTDEGIEWDGRSPKDRDDNPVCDDTIVDYLTREYVYAEAGSWSNSRIRAFIDRSARRD